MVIDERLHAVARCRVDGADAIFDACQTILLGTYPQATVRSSSHNGNLLAGQRSFIVYETFVARTIPYLAVAVFCNGCDVAVNQRLELIDVVAIVG